MLTSPRLRPKPIDKFAFTTGGDAEMSKNACVIFEMKDVNRQVVMLVLDKIEKDGTEEFLTCLEAWKLMEVKKVAVRIAEVENTIKNREKLSEW